MNIGVDELEIYKYLTYASLIIFAKILHLVRAIKWCNIGLGVTLDSLAYVRCL